MAEPNPTLVPSAQRPVPLRRRGDLIARQVDFGEDGSWVVKDPVGLTYQRLTNEQYRVLQLLDGQRGLKAIREELLREFPLFDLELADVQELVSDLHRRGLAYGVRPGKPNRPPNRRDGTRNYGLPNLLSLRLPGWDPEPLFRHLYPLVAWMFRPWAVAIAVALVGGSWLLLAVQFDAFQRRLPEFYQFFGWPNLIYLWLAMAAVKVLHEFGHGLTCRHFGCECHEIGVMLLVFSPTLYCETSDSWTLRNKWQRIAIGGAGMYVEVVLSALAVLVWWNTQPGLLNYLSLNVFFVTTLSTVIFNLNPLMRLDGYYMLSDWLETPNLRATADQLLRDQFGWYCLGIEPRPDPWLPKTGRAWLIAYAIAAGIYRWVVLVGIGVFLYFVLKPIGLQNLGVSIAVVSGGLVAVGGLRNVWRMIAAPRREPMSFRKVTLSLSVLSAAIGVALAVPLPLFHTSPILVEPHEATHVLTATAGRLVSVHVQPGEFVHQGDPLATLTSPELEDRQRRLETQRKIQQVREAAFRSRGDTTQQQLAREHLASLTAQQDELATQMRHLTIVASCDGRVVEPPEIAEPIADGSRSLHRWHGTPLEPRNLGCYLERRTHLLTLAPSDRYEATLLVDQSGRNDIAIGRVVEIKFDHLPNRTFRGRIERIAEQQSDFAPQSLSNKRGGELPTVTDRLGRERLTSVAYETTVVLEDDVHLLRPGLRGRARINYRRTAGEWLWRQLRRTVRVS